MTALRRGFKTWCENAAYGYRRDLGLARNAALPPQELASHLGVTILTPEDLPALQMAARRHLVVTDPSSWSAVTLKMGSRIVMVVNSGHSVVRGNSNIAHELAHLILEHRATQVFMMDGKMMMKEYDRIQEHEAECLSGALLVPRQALLDLLQQGVPEAELAAYFGVSRELLQMRRLTTGVERQLGYRSRA